MIDLPSDYARHDAATGIGTQPIALAAAILLVLVTGVAGIALWRSYNGTSPELDRAVAARKLQAARTVLVSEQLVEKTKGLEETQQQSIDQLQLAQDQLQTLKRQLAAQEADNKRLSEQVADLTEAVDGLRQSLASAEPAIPSATRHRSSRAKPQDTKTAQKR